ncbi:snapalysin [Allocatelliglobosispora scoriae]|uniref:Extracellular small neutral protease n=1 Tax=Allocatelliglobosispora scoriae TaxID=643052 RepID=A0A841C0X9_9ACTN|nr:snapalysin family zinc-dependent metalloprotease [Allocatelliglobosispora scoriae]MBB5873585.1 snapalysin [Allocatelliglobosispora scoriae]
MRFDLKRVAVATLAAAAMTLSIQALGPGTATAAPAVASVRVLYYDASGAGEFVNAVHQGAANWNARVTNVRLERWTSGRTRNVRVLVDNGWPRAYVNSLGNGTIYMGRQAVTEGHNPTRIAAHELGHILGLPDRRTGVCADLMSGASAGTSCTSAVPNSREIAEVNALFAGSVLVAAGWRSEAG